MYRFMYMKAVNLCGFKSGLSRKVFEIDLSESIENGADIWAVSGSNASGKSTFLSLIHPTVYPTNGRRKFVIDGKEGLVVRKYIDNDGTIITSKCIYKPKKDSGHTPSCFLSIKKPGCDEIEMNPNGNIASYEELLYTYFGITKDFITYATYSNEVASIVRMSDTERKNSVGTLIPNTKRFQLGYDIVNGKYRDLRTIIRNLSQKILALRDEDSLVADYDRLTSELKNITEEREEKIRKLSKLEGRLKEITGGDDLDKLNNQYSELLMRDASQSKELYSTMSEIHGYYKILGIKPVSKDSIMCPELASMGSTILELERKAAFSRSQLLNYSERKSQLQDELGQIDQELMEIESSLYSIQTQDIAELMETKKEYKNRLREMRYTKNPDAYENMSYDEIVAFSRTMVMIDQMIHALYDEYGQLVTEYFNASDWSAYVDKGVADVNTLHVTIATRSTKKDQLYRSLIEKQQYKQIASVLSQRPKSCNIDTCPFIAQALKYQNIAEEIADLAQEYKDISVELEDLDKQIRSCESRVTIHEDAQKLVQFLKDNFSLMKKYLDLDSLDTFYKAIANGTWDKYLDMIRIKDLTAILSEKSLYLEIKNIRLPEIDHAIEMAKVYGTNRDLLESQAAHKREHRVDIVAKLDELDMHIGIHKKQRHRYEVRLGNWKMVEQLVNRYRSIASSHIADQEAIKEQADKIKMINEMVQKGKELDDKIRQLDDMIRERTPMRERVKLDLDAVRRIKIEQLEVERNFTVIDVVRSIMSPGKGIRKELINLYMYEIYQITNQLLLNTFDGKLYLKEFLITDKEFIIPYVYNGTESPDISFASSAQQATITSALSLAILSKLIDKYGVYTPDELDNTLAPTVRDSYIDVLLKHARYVGLTQIILITQDPERYIKYPNAVFIKFPGGASLDQKGLDIIEV